MFFFCKSRKNYILILLIALAIFLRLYRIEEKFLFSSENNVKLWPIKKVVVDRKPTLVGIEAVSYLHHLFYPPFAIYIFAPILLLSDLNPLSIEIALILLSGLTVYLLYRAGKELFKEEVGLLAAFFYTFSFSMQIIDRYIWVVGPLLFFLIIILLFLKKILSKKNNLCDVLFLGSALGLSFNFHYQTGIIFISLLAVFLIYRQKFISLKSLLVIISSVLFFFLPLLIFDLRHKFFNLEGIKILLTTNEFSLPFKEKLAQSLLFITQNFLSIFTKKFYFKLGSTSAPFWLQILVIIFLFLLPFFAFFKSKKAWKKMIYLFLFFLILFGFLGTTFIVNKFYRINYYLFYLQPIFMLFIGWVFTFWFKNGFLKIMAFFFLLAFLIINLKDSLEFKRGVNYRDQLRAASYILDNAQGKIEIFLPKCPQNRYDFLFYYLARKKGIDYDKIVFYQPWQPVNKARFLLYYTDQGLSPVKYKKFGHIIVEERIFDED